VGTYDVASLLNRSGKHVAPDAVVSQGNDWQPAWNTLEAARQSFLDVYRSGDGLALGDVIYHHPRLGRLNLYQWAVWLGAHEARHTEQVHEISATLNPEPESIA